MLVVKLSDQLGNQMFAYAAVKSIALDKGFEFGVCNEYDNQFLKNDTDEKFGNTLTSIFPQIRQEIVSELSNYANFQEITNYQSKSSIQKTAYEVMDNTLMLGHYISPLYFMHRIDEVREWFTLPAEILKKAEKHCQKLRQNILRTQNFARYISEMLSITESKDSCLIKIIGTMPQMKYLKIRKEMNLLYF